MGREDETTDFEHTCTCGLIPRQIQGEFSFLLVRARDITIFISLYNTV
jgi:hypothetical protein